MQAWDQVKVSDVDSEHAGEAGMVVGTRTADGVAHASVKLDNGETVEFLQSSLQRLG